MLLVSGAMCCYTVMRCHTLSGCFVFLMIRRPPRSTLDRSSAASDVYKRQGFINLEAFEGTGSLGGWKSSCSANLIAADGVLNSPDYTPVSYTHLRAHETVLDLVCRLLLEKQKHTTHTHTQQTPHITQT